eukprot:gene24061-10162_t
MAGHGYELQAAALEHELRQDVQISSNDPKHVRAEFKYDYPTHKVVRKQCFRVWADTGMGSHRFLEFCMPIPKLKT